MSELPQFVSFNDTLLGLEGLLYINVKESILEQVTMSTREISARLKVDLEDRDLLQAREADPMLQDRIDEFLVQIAQCLKNVSYITALSLFNNRLDYSLKDVSYMGYNRERMHNCLKYVINRQVYAKRTEMLPVLIARASRLEIGPVRRLFCVVAVLERLGIQEGVGLICQYLYLGTKM